MSDAAPFDAGEMPDFLNRLKRRHQQEIALPRTATLKEHEGRTLPDLSAKTETKKESNGPDRDEFLFAIGHQKKLQQAVDDAKAAMKKFRNHLKLRGFNLAMMDVAIDEAGREDGTTITNMRDLKRYYEFMGLPIGHQFSLFDTPQAANANTDLFEKAFTEGRERGIRGEFADEQKWPPMTPEGQEHMRGWNEGQETHRAKFTALEESFAEADKAALAKLEKRAKGKSKENPSAEGGAEAPADDAKPTKKRAGKGVH